MWDVIHKLRDLRSGGFGAYYKNGQFIKTAAYGDQITYNVPGQPPGQIWLSQFVNNSLGYDGPFTIPMAPYTLSAKDKPGLWVSNAYTYAHGYKGTMLETSTLQVSATPIQAPAGGGSSILTPSPAPSGGGAPPVTIATLPQIPGAAPTSGGPQVGANCLDQTYRFILAVTGGFATGSNRPGCSQTNSANCDPQFFPTLNAAIAYAHQNGETPYRVDSAQEPWDLMNCIIQIDPKKIIGGGIPWGLIAAGAAVIYLLGRRG